MLKTQRQTIDEVAEGIRSRAAGLIPVCVDVLRRVQSQTVGADEGALVLALLLGYVCQRSGRGLGTAVGLARLAGRASVDVLAGKIKAR